MRGVSPEDDLDLEPLEDDPVVRSPRRLAERPEPVDIGLRAVLLVALGAASLGGALGGVGLAIVVAVAPPRRVRVRAPRAAAVAPLEPAEHPREPLAGVRPSEVERSQLTLGRGRTLASALRLLGLTREEPRAVIQGLRRQVNLRALRPTDVVVALRDPQTHTLRRVQFRRGPTQVWEAARGGDGRWEVTTVTARHETVQVAVAWETPRGPAGASLRALGIEPEALVPVGEALTALGLAPRLRPGEVLRVVLDEERLNDGFYRYGRVLALDHQGLGGHRRAYRFCLGSGAGDLYDAEGFAPERGVLRGPVPGARLSSRFDMHRVHPVLRVPRPHLGVDFAAPTGTAVVSSAEGVVLSSGPSGPSGNLVRVLHRALGLETGYAHLSRFAPGVRAGQRVRAGQLLGAVGSTGRSTGPHLHFSVRRGGSYVDPLVYHTPRTRLPDEALAAFRATVAVLGAALDRVAVDAPAVVLDAPADPAPAPVAPMDEGASQAPEEAPGEPEEALDVDDAPRGD